MSHNDHDEKRGFLSSSANIALIVFLAIAGYFLITEHRAHIATAIPYLPFLLLLACPFLHIFMHGGHGEHRRDDRPDDETSDRRTNTPHAH